MTHEQKFSAQIKRAFHPFTGERKDYDALLARAGQASIVLIGAASHGTHEFCRIRAELTERLIAEQGFAAVAVAADWPDAWRVNRFVQGRGDDALPAEALADFKRFPAWIWRNAEVVDFLGFLADFNQARPAAEKVGFYGLDLYSLHGSSEALLRCLDELDPSAAGQARRRYAGFEQCGREEESHGSAMSYVRPDCQDEAVRQLTARQSKAFESLHRHGAVAEDEQFFAEQGARAAREAERYYRAMFAGRISSWNLREQHMAQTLAALSEHLQRRRAPKLVVWAHNTHVGDARATEMGELGGLSLSQLIRERYGEQVLSIGFTTHVGTVAAASAWGGPVERMALQPSLEGSWERMFHENAPAPWALLLNQKAWLGQMLATPRLQRAIGVVYAPQTERGSHYFRARLSAQFDAVIHVDLTRALQPLEQASGWEQAEPPASDGRGGQ
jgi:erythromycin esterase-like protein